VIDAVARDSAVPPHDPPDALDQPHDVDHGRN
jgi:hypothetical protein